MAVTWRDERPEAITAASHSAERPSSAMVTMFSALSSSSEARMRRRRSLGAAGLRAGLGAADFFLAGLAGLGAFRFGLAAFLMALLPGFFAGADLRVRGIPPVSESNLAWRRARFQDYAPARSAVELCRLRGPSSRMIAGGRRNVRARPKWRTGAALSAAMSEPG